MRNETFNTDINYDLYALKIWPYGVKQDYWKESHDAEHHSYRNSAYRIESDRMKFDVKVIKLFDIFERFFFVAVEVIGLTDEWKKLSFSGTINSYSISFLCSSRSRTHIQLLVRMHSLPRFSALGRKFADFFWFSPYYVSHEHSLSI